MSFSAYLVGKLLLAFVAGYAFGLLYKHIRQIGEKI